MRNIADRSCRENQTHILCTIIIFPQKILPFMP